MLTAIIVAGGSSRRMGFDKTFAMLAGRPVIAHAIAAFEASACVNSIIVVGRQERLDKLQASTSASKVSQVIAGGEQRQDSVAEGLKCLSAETTYVAVHDAARPLITPAEITRVFTAAQESGAAALAAPVTDTLKRATEAYVVCGSVERERLYAMQTPQIFSRQLIEEAFARVETDKLLVTDEVSAVERLGREIVLVPNENYNFKITFPHDLALAELVLKLRVGEDR